MIKIMVLSGKRGGYDAMFPMLLAMQADPDIELHLILTDQHTRPKFGQTQRDVSLPYEEIKTVFDSDGSVDKSANRAYGLGRIMSEMSFKIGMHKPDILVLYGDRGESLAAAVAASQMLIPIAHLQAGDTSGTLDDRFRWAISVLSTLRFSSCYDSAFNCDHKRLSSHIVGDHHIDPIATHTPVKDSPRSREYCILLQHSNSERPEDSAHDINVTLEALSSYAGDVVAIYPCSDPGHDAIIDALEHSGYDTFKNIPGPVFRELMHHAQFIIGNSSAGIIEAPYYKLPAVNIGDRQKGRLTTQWTYHAKHDVTCISQAIGCALSHKEYEETLPYGDGTAGEQTITIIKGWADANNIH